MILSIVRAIVDRLFPPKVRMVRDYKRMHCGEVLVVAGKCSAYGVIKDDGKWRLTEGTIDDKAVVAEALYGMGPKGVKRALADMEVPADVPVRRFSFRRQAAR